ncbi:MAG TPA: DUF4124 domain-containing protein [Burkholderiaceae bacterium]|nr:DUF4124 domain-containing protein [Burkholderiaceae bacterium]
MFRTIALLSVAFALPVATAQQIQRCEGAGGGITYSNAKCPTGTTPVKSLQPADTPSAEAQQAARERAARDAEAAQQLAQQRRTQQAALAQQQQQTQQVRNEQRKADCAYLQGEIQSVHRMRNLLVNRPYYSLDDLEQMDRHAEQLVADYRRVCG